MVVILVDMIVISAMIEFPGRLLMIMVMLCSLIVGVRAGGATGGRPVAAFEAAGAASAVEFGPISMPVQPGNQAQGYREELDCAKGEACEHQRLSVGAEEILLLVLIFIVRGSHWMGGV